MIGELYPGEFEAMEHNGRMDALVQEPCDVFDEYGNYKYPSDVELTEPNTATSMPCEDAISRQAVLDEISDYNNDLDYTTNELYDRIKRMSSVTPKPKTGHWILGGYDDNYYICDRCNYKASEYYFKPHYTYCPNCGAKMEEEE